jgi:hypothetical protein
MLEFIRKRRYAKTQSDSHTIATSKQAKLIPNQVFRTETGSEVTLPTGMSNFIESNIDKIDEKWKQFARVEPDKLEWMQNVKVRNIQGEVKIRVDFDGIVVNPLSDISWRKERHPLPLKNQGWETRRRFPSLLKNQH